MGAYNLDGTLKAGAQVLYVTEANKKTVTMTIKGAKYTGVAAITQQIKIKNKLGPVAIRVVGQVTLDGLESVDMAGSFAMGVKGASEVTIEGIGNDATLLCGVAAYQSENIEVRNLGFMLWGGGHDGDGITLKSTVGVWVHNNDLFYGEPGADADQVKGDGSMDLKDDSQYVTIAYNHFWDTGKSSLCGMKKKPDQTIFHIIITGLIILIVDILELDQCQYMSTTIIMMDALVMVLVLLIMEKLLLKTTISEMSNIQCLSLYKVQTNKLEVLSQVKMVDLLNHLEML